MPGGRTARGSGRGPQTAASTATARTANGGGTQGWSGAGKFNSQLNSQKKAFKKPTSSSLQVPASEHQQLMTRKSYQDIFASIKPDEASLGHFATVVGAFQRSGGSRTSANGMQELLLAAGASSAAPAAAAVVGSSGGTPASTTGQRRRSNSSRSKKPSTGPISLPEKLQSTAKQLTAAVAAGARSQTSPLVASPVTQSRYSAGYTSPPSAADPPSPPSGGSGGGGEGKKANRLEKNRLAAKECRRKKKEYVGDLEEKVRGLEQRNEDLLEQLMHAKSSLTPAERRNLEARSQQYLRQ